MNFFVSVIKNIRIKMVVIVSYEALKIFNFESVNIVFELRKNELRWIHEVYKVLFNLFRERLDSLKELKNFFKYTVGYDLWLKLNRN